LTEIHQLKNINYPIEINGKDEGNVIKGETGRDVFRSQFLVKTFLYFFFSGNKMIIQNQPTKRLQYYSL